ncbi:MAG: cation-translocating P-type ATPase [Deinococcales bacterium]
MTQSSLAKLESELREDAKILRLNIILTTLTALGLILSVVLNLSGAPKIWVIASYLLSFLAGGLPAGREALAELFRGKLDIDLLMVTAALAAAAVGEPRDGAILLFLFSLAGTLEDYAMGRTKRTVSSLMKLRPDKAIRLKNGQEYEVDIEDLALGDIVLIKSGERIPVDGTIIQGQSSIDQSTITGESLPVDKGVGAEVFAGTVNGSGVLDIKVTKLASDSTLAQMVRLVTEAQSQRAPSQRFSDWFGQRYTIFVLVGTLVALAIFFLIGLKAHDAFYKAATLLVVASPCAVVISVPAAILSALAAAARGGVLFKGGAALESFAKIKQLAFDKTGTITLGKPQVTDIIALEGDEKSLLQRTASLESRSEHPIAQNIVQRARAEGLKLNEVSDVQSITGHGLEGSIEGEILWAGNRKMAGRYGIHLSQDVENEVKALESQGKTSVFIGDKAKLLGIISLADTLRGNAKSALEALKAAGVSKFAMLTGDHNEAASHIAKQLGLAQDEVYADLLPEDKVKHIERLKEQGDIAFIGDGVNDAAALASAHVGVAMGSAGSDVALEAADVALLSDDLSRIAPALQLAQKADRIVKQNLSFAVGAMMVLVLFTLFGNLPLPLGVIGHEGGTLIVVANGLRLLRGIRS